MKALLERRESVLAIVILALGAAVALRAPVFMRPGNLLDIVTDSSILTMMTLAQMAVIMTRGIDLSVASTLAFAGMAAALLGKAHPELPVLVLVALGVGLGVLLGAVNGVLIAGLGIPPIVATLGTLSVYRGLAFILAGGKWVNSHEMTPGFLALPRIAILGLPLLVWIAIAVTAAFAVFLGFSRTGRALYAAGGNPLAARTVGIAVPRLQFLVYVLSGAVAGLCGVLWVARFGIASSEIVVGYELQVVAACVIGGVSIAGGLGTVAGAVLGALFLGVINNALSIINVSPFWQMAIAGAAILAAVVINARAERRPGKLILPEARRAALGGTGR